MYTIIDCRVRLFDLLLYVYVYSVRELSSNIERGEVLEVIISSFTKFLWNPSSYGFLLSLVSLTHFTIRILYRRLVFVLLQVQKYCSFEVLWYIFVAHKWNQNGSVLPISCVFIWTRVRFPFAFITPVPPELSKICMVKRGDKILKNH